MKYRALQKAKSINVSNSIATKNLERMESIISLYQMLASKIKRRGGAYHFGEYDE